MHVHRCIYIYIDLCIYIHICIYLHVINVLVYTYIIHTTFLWVSEVLRTPRDRCQVVGSCPECFDGAGKRGFEDLGSQSPLP